MHVIAFADDVRPTAIAAVARSFFNINLIPPSLKLTREWVWNKRAKELSTGLVAIAETRIVLRNDQAVGAFSSMVKIMCRRRANVADENFGCEPAKKNEEHDRSYDEEEKFTKHSGHSSDVKITWVWVRSGAPICLCGSFA
ncbi:hypothetical protein [Sinorhizobium medicae]|uniref:hypothetical protein n=1 Tax=Sinorhizobium medicae TaxID=110321 RepID=UPI0011B5BAF3|nr:hypothetical protein [Sinorhizobium medicae]